MIYKLLLFCKSFQWAPTLVSLALGKIEWFDLTGLMELPKKTEIRKDFLSWAGLGDDDYPEDDNQCIVYAEKAAPAHLDTELVRQFLEEWMAEA